MGSEWYIELMREMEFIVAMKTVEEVAGQIEQFGEAKNREELDEKVNKMKKKLDEIIKDGEVCKATYNSISHVQSQSFVA